MWAFYIPSMACVLVAVIVLCVWPPCCRTAQVLPLGEANQDAYLATLWHPAGRLRRYASPQVPFSARCLAVLGWLTSISVVALVPVDVWSTLNESSNPSITIMWKACYWCAL